jgi:hypothetical protein
MAVLIFAYFFSRMHSWWQVRKSQRVNSAPAGEMESFKSESGQLQL